MPLVAVGDWLLKIFSDGLTSAQRRQFVLIVWRMSSTCALLWAFGLLGPHSGFATADDMDKKIAQAMAPVIEELKSINQKLERSNNNQRRMMVSDVSNKIRDLQQLCLSAEKGTVARHRLRSLLGDAQEEYRSLTGGFYPLGVQCD